MTTSDRTRSAAAPRPRRTRRVPAYPRQVGMAATVLAISTGMGCAKEPAIPGNMPGPFEMGPPGSAATAYPTVTAAQPTSAPVEGDAGSAFATPPDDEMPEPTGR